MGESTSQTRLLAVDDEAVIAEMLAELLSDQGLPCQSCTSGAEALERLAREDFSLVISDIRMPGMSGLELLGQIRTKFPHVAVVMVTVEGDVRVGIEAMKRGAADYLVKPFQCEAVVASVHRAMEKHRLELEVERYRKHLEEMVEQRTAQLQTAFKQIETIYDETLQALGGALDLRDNETAGHSQRVTAYCAEIARVMGCKDEQQKEISRGAYLHDIGKIGIPDAILLKPGKLSDPERAIMETHVRIGYDLVSGISFLAAAAHIVLTHQERYDGKGYPQGLAGDGIPLGARIFAVADTLDAMTSDRPYRKALPYSRAREEISRESGRQFDPAVVDVFLSIPDAEWLNIRSEVVPVSYKHRRNYESCASSCSP